MLLRLKEPIVNIDGEKLTKMVDWVETPTMLNECIAKDVLADAPNATENALKFTEWGEELFKKWELNLDSTDLKIFEQLVKESWLRTFIKWQTLRLIDTARLASSLKPTNPEKE